MTNQALEAQKTYYQRHKEKIKEKKRLFQLENPDKRYLANKKYQEQNKEKIRFWLKKSRLKRMYGITIEDYDCIFNKQQGKCACCGILNENLTKELSVDHCHETGKIRGLLCHNCNTALGLIKDNVDVLKQMLIYISTN